MTLIRTFEVKHDLATRGKWTLEPNLSQDVCIYIYTHIFAKAKFQKTYTIVNALYILEFYYFLCVTLKLYMLRMTQNYILRKYSLYNI